MIINFIKLRELFFNLAAKPENSSGRIHPEEPCPLRTVYQRDRDRIIHSKAFRRLKFKSQVFFANTNDLYRTRLTHTIEVSQIARTIACNLGLNVDLCEAVALSHDLGHSPFGHTGEEKLNQLLMNIGGFNHNIQTVKLVTRLERQYLAFFGLNLASETLEGIFKHNGPFDCKGEINSIFRSEITLIGGCKHYPTLEAQVASLSDDIAYCAHDISDAFESRVLTASDLRKAPFFSDFLTNDRNIMKNIPEDLIVAQACRNLIKFLVNDLIDQTKDRLNLITERSLSKKEFSNELQVSFSRETTIRIKNLKQFLFDNFYRSSTINLMREKAEEVIEKLFKHYIKNYDNLPNSWKENPYYLSFTDEEYKRLNLVGDFIGGMTDKYALDIYEKIN